jgi:hypothetical protein
MQQNIESEEIANSRSVGHIELFAQVDLRKMTKDSRHGREGVVPSLVVRHQPSLPPSFRKRTVLKLCR